MAAAPPSPKLLPDAGTQIGSAPPASRNEEAQKGASEGGNSGIGSMFSKLMSPGEGPGAMLGGGAGEAAGAGGIEDLAVLAA
jgi:hypothetical protein